MPCIIDGPNQEIWFDSPQVKKPDHLAGNSQYFSCDQGTYGIQVGALPLGYAGELDCVCGCWLAGRSAVEVSGGRLRIEMHRWLTTEHGVRWCKTFHTASRSRLLLPEAGQINLWFHVSQKCIPIWRSDFADLHQVSQISYSAYFPFTGSSTVNRLT